MHLQGKLAVLVAKNEIALLSWETSPNLAKILDLYPYFANLRLDLLKKKIDGHPLEIDDVVSIEANLFKTANILCEPIVT